MTSFADQPLVGSVDADGNPTVFTFHTEIKKVGKKEQSVAVPDWEPNEVFCGTCRCRATRDPKADTCDCRCHETWQNWQRKLVEASR